MKFSVRTICAIAALGVVPVLASAQAKPDPKAMKSAMKADTGAMKHDMDKMKPGDEGKKHDMDAKQGMGGHDEASGWKELDAFHGLLKDTWHPAEKGDLTAARAKAPAFVAAAQAWEKSKGPDKCDNAAARKALPGVVGDAKAYADVVKASGSDDAVKAALKKAHDAFEAVAMPCMMGAMKGMDHAPKKP